jgi:hypothetical protein
MSNTNRKQEYVTSNIQKAQMASVRIECRRYIQAALTPADAAARTARTERILRMANFRRFLPANVKL